MIFLNVLQHLQCHYSRIIHWHSILTYTKIQSYAQSLHQVGGLPGIWGFLDGMFRPICCNRTTPVSSLKASVKLSARTWPRPRMNMWIPEELPRTAQSYTGAMSMILMRLTRMARLACCPETTSYSWMLLFSLFVRLACSL